MENKATQKIGPIYAPLPEKQTLEGSKISELKWLLYGCAGIGKSTFFSKASDGNRKPLFLHTDPGLRFIQAYKIPIFSWKQFDHYVKELTKDGGKAAGKKYSMIVLDTTDLLFRMCRRDICKARNLEHISDAEWGKGYDLVRDAFEQTIVKLAKLDEAKIGLAFISHAKDVEIRGRAIRTSKLVPTLPKQCHDIVAPLVDIIGYAGFSEAKADKTKDGEMGRIVMFSPDETVEAKDRTGLLPARTRLDFEVVKECLEGNPPEEGIRPLKDEDKVVEEEIE